MRYLVCSDIHGNLSYFEEALSREFSEGVEGIIISGDLEVSVSEIYDIIDEISEGEISRTNTHIVRGNCDGYMGSNLPLVDVFEDSGHRIVLTHGHLQGVPRRNEMYLLASSEGCDVAIFGHSHIPEDSMEDEVRFINPGALKLNRYADKASTYMILDISEDEIEAELKQV